MDVDYTFSYRCMSLGLPSVSRIYGCSKILRGFLAGMYTYSAGAMNNRDWIGEYGVSVAKACSTNTANTGSILLLINKITALFARSLCAAAFESVVRLRHPRALYA